MSHKHGHCGSCIWMAVGRVGRDRTTDLFHRFEITSPAPLPSNLGVTLDATSGAITGTPTGSIPTTNVEFRITDGRGLVSSFNCSIVVSSAVMNAVVSWMILAAIMLFASQ